MTSDYHPELDRLVWGAKDIATVIGRSTRQTNYLLERGYISADKVGGMWRSSVRRLLFSKVKQVETLTSGGSDA